MHRHGESRDQSGWCRYAASLLRRRLHLVAPHPEVESQQGLRVLCAASIVLVSLAAVPTLRGQADGGRVRLVEYRVGGDAFARVMCALALLQPSAG
jgi:hypothetical protein